jgi:NAD dependent epimerase/dehydratase family enzyme
LVDLFCFALNNRLEGVYNAVAPNPVTQTKLIKAVARCLKRPVWLPSIPASVLKIALGSRAVLVLASQRVSAYKIQESGFSFRYANLVAALENLLEGKKQ